MRELAIAQKYEEEIDGHIYTVTKYTNGTIVKIIKGSEPPEGVEEPKVEETEEIEETTEELK